MTSPILLDSEIDKVLALVNEAGNTLLGYWPGSGKDEGTLGVLHKEDGTPVSKADFASNEILTKGLTKAFPADVIISEENTYPSQNAAKRKWIIDPLDGTKSFIAGRDDFSVLVGLAIDSKIAAGFMYFPALKNLMWCVGDKGYPEGLTVSVETSLRAGRIYIAKMPDFPRPELMCPHIDSGLAFQRVACGELDGLIIKMTTHAEWDIAAPAASILRAGGMLTDENGNELAFGLKPRPCEYCVASNGRIHDRLLALTK